ncbi:MAG: NYN domain-containing protein [Candidatus Eisenbacteria bacterium]|nr:NYN domain-containing protein [Candidatus Eisenbacteria bacterium]
MRYLIDGSNVLGAKGELGCSGSAERLLGNVERFCRTGHATSVVVFDGMDGHRPGRMFRYGERVWVRIPPASEQRDRADREIISLVRRHEGDTVVTSDASLAGAARALGAGVIDAQAFLRRLTTVTITGSEKDAAATGIDNAELLRLWAASTEEPT